MSKRETTKTPKVNMEEYEKAVREIDAQSGSISRPKKSIVQIQEVIDSNTGEILESYETSNTVQKVGSEPPFVKLYLADLSALYGLTPVTHSVLLELLNYMTYDNEIIINKLRKDRIKEKLNLKTEKTVTNAVSDLKKAGILINIGRGTYIANPYIFGKGTWVGNVSKIRTSITYTSEGRKIESEIIE